MILSHSFVSYAVEKRFGPGLVKDDIQLGLLDWVVQFNIVFLFVDFLGEENVVAFEFEAGFVRDNGVTINILVHNLEK